MLIGYLRPYQDDLDCEGQQETLSSLHCDMMIIEEHSSSKHRIHLLEMISNLKKNDKIVITKLFVLADSSRHLLDLLEKIRLKGAYLFSLSENIDTSFKSSYDLFNVLKHLVAFQSDVISEKTKKGLLVAKDKGISTGRPRKSDKNITRAIEMYQSKNYSLAQIKEETGISKSTLYRYLEN